MIDHLYRNPKCPRCGKFMRYDDGFDFIGLCERCHVCQMFEELERDEVTGAIIDPVFTRKVEREEDLPF